MQMFSLHHTVHQGTIALQRFISIALQIWDALVQSSSRSFPLPRSKQHDRILFKGRRWTLQISPLSGVDGHVQCKYILQFGQIHLAIFANTFCSPAALPLEWCRWPHCSNIDSVRSVQHVIWGTNTTTSPPTLFPSKVLETVNEH